MTFEEMTDAWDSQKTPSRTSQSIEQMIRRRNRSVKHQLALSLVITLVVVVFGVFNFYGQFVQNGDGLWVAVLRAVPVFAATAIHVYFYNQVAKEHRERLTLGASHCQWLRHWIIRLERESSGQGWYKLAAFFIFLVAVTATTKWLDFRSGEDSLLECLGIVSFVVALCVMVSAGVWHHRTQFLIPELNRCRRMLGDLEESESV